MILFGCLFGMFAAFAPRLAFLFYWLARPAMVNAAFNTFILPCLGFIFLPFTTLMYVFLVQGVGTIQGLDWLWLLLAVVLDLGSLGASAAANRDRIPGGHQNYAEKELSAATPVQPSAAPPVQPSAAPSVPPSAAPDQPAESNPQ
jgi:hypothetical protein